MTGADRPGWAVSGRHRARRIPIGWCDCGEPLHYLDLRAQRRVTALVAELGPTITVSVNGRSWAVPRHYIALHGLAAAELPVLAARFRWPRLAGHGSGPDDRG